LGAITVYYAEQQDRQSCFNVQSYILNMIPQDLQGKLRARIIDMNYKAKSGHIGSALSCLDILITYFYNRQPGDSLILSKGHATSAIYAVLNELGEISNEVMETFYKNASVMTGHPAPLKFPSIPFATGSLGHGFPLAAGIAKAKKIKKEGGTSYVLMSDGETNEGTTWEAMHFAIQNKLDNLVAIIDKNRWQGFGNISDVLGDTSSPVVWKTIGFEVSEVQGHDLVAIKNEFAIANQHKNGIPKVIIANTIKGKGVDFMEDTLDWHYLSMNEAQYRAAQASVAANYGL